MDDAQHAQLSAFAMPADRVQQLGTFHESPFASCLCQCLGHVRPVRQAFVDPADRLDGHTEGQSGHVVTAACDPQRSLAQAEVGHHDAEVILRMLHAAGAFAHLPVEIVIDALCVFPIFPDGEGLSVVGCRGGKVLPFVVEHGGVARGGIAVEEPRFGGDERADRIAFAVEAAVSLREQAAQVVWNLMGEGDGSRPAAPHADVAQGRWYSPAVNWAVDAKVMDGYDADTFGVGDALTREQFAAVVAKAAGADVSAADAASLDVFSDAEDVSGWAVQTMAWAVETGVIEGVEGEDGSRSLDATRALTRAEMAAMVMNAVDKGVLALPSKQNA